MSKVLVYRGLLRDCSAELSDWRMSFPNADSGMTDRLVGEIDAILAQPAEAEGVSNARLMNTLAELARRAPLRTLHTICETQHQVSTVKLERYLGPVGDTLAGYAFTLRIDFDKLSAALSAVTAERDRLLASKLYWVAPAGSGLVRCVTDERYRKFSPSIRAKYDPVCCVDAAMDAKGATHE